MIADGPQKSWDYAMSLFQWVVTTVLSLPGTVVSVLVILEAIQKKGDPRLNSLVKKPPPQ